MLAAHGGQYGLGHGHVAEEVGFELQADFIELHVFRETSYGEAGIIHQHVEASVVTNERFDERRNGIKVCDVELAAINLSRNTGSGGRLIEPLTAAEVAHGGDDVKAAFA